MTVRGQLQQLRERLRRVRGYERTPETGDSCISRGLVRAPASCTCLIGEDPARWSEHRPGCPLGPTPGADLDRQLDEALDEQDPREDPDERVLPRTVQVEAEDTLNAGFGLPPVWRCPCGGRPFVPQDCPRCGRGISERWDA